jgi:hypothetical protein
MDRFHVVVFNYERICSFIDNFDKIVNFNPMLDRIFIIDCSKNHESQKKEIDDFAKRNNLTIGEQIHFIRRRNWGIDQGGRIDYFISLHQSANKPKYIWQFQEHYLDLVSPWSIYQEDIYNVDGKSFGGRVKGDVIPDKLTIDLDDCERIYEMHPEVSVIYADRLNIGIFPYLEREFFYLDGGNFSIRTTAALRSFDRKFLMNCKLIHDFTYKWALFMEFKWGFQMTFNHEGFYDLISHYNFGDMQTLEKIESEHNLCLHQVAEKHYNELYAKYESNYLQTSKSNIFCKLRLMTTVELTNLKFYIRNHVFS